MFQRVYLDHAAGAPLRPQARAAMDAVWSLPGNPSSLHASGRTSRRILEDSREALAGCLGAQPSEVVFTSGGTEANNLILLGALGRARIVRDWRSGTEHPSVAEVSALHPDRVDVLGVDADGRLLSDLSVIGAQTAVVSVMSVNNETGVVQPLDRVLAAAGKAGAWCHSDAAQAFGHLPLDFGTLGVDALTVTAHKIGGPVGIGALLLRRELSLAAPGFGGGQERKLRSGTAMTALAAGFAAAAQATAEAETEAARLDGLRGRLASGVLELVPEVSLNGVAPISPAILNVTFHGCRADDLLLILDAAGIDCSTGSACTAGVHRPSEVLLAMARSEADASASLRFSFGPATEEESIGRLLAVLPDAVVRARAAFL